MRRFVQVCLLVLLVSAGSQAKTIKLGSCSLAVEIHDVTARSTQSGSFWFTDCFYPFWGHKKSL